MYAPYLHGDLIRESGFRREEELCRPAEEASDKGLQEVPALTKRYIARAHGDGEREEEAHRQVQHETDTYPPESGEDGGGGERVEAEGRGGQRDGSHRQ